MLRILFIVSLCFYLSGCNESPDDLNFLYRQRIPNNAQVIYRYRVGGPAWGAGSFRMTILDSSFSLFGDRVDMLPYGIFDGAPGPHHSRILNISFDKTSPGDTSLMPIKHYQVSCNGHEVEILKYRRTYGYASNAGLSIYTFESFREGPDSVSFYDIKDENGARKFPCLSFVKGNVTIVDSIPGNVDYIELEQAFIARGEIYKPEDRKHLVPNCPIVDLIVYRLYPIRQLRTNDFSDFGIYKRVK